LFEAHTTWLVRSSIELSDNVPIARNGCTSPIGMLAFAGVTAIDCRTAGVVTVITVDPITPFNAALIVEVPGVRALASPLEPAAFEIVATPALVDAHVTWPVRSWRELSEKVPMAVNCLVWPAGTLALAGVTAIDDRLGSTMIVPDMPLAV